MHFEVKFRCGILILSELKFNIYLQAEIMNLILDVGCSLKTDLLLSSKQYQEMQFQAFEAKPLNHMNVLSSPKRCFDKF
jgi:hypothetical protein